MHEYGNIADKNYSDTNVMISDKGFQQVGQGIRYDVDNYNDLYT